MKSFCLALVTAMSLSTVRGQQAKAPDSAAASPASLVVVGATLVDVRNGREIEDTTVLIRGDRLVQVGLRDKLQVPSDARLIDAHGKWIVPGLIDMHVHLWDGDVVPLRLFLANGVTTIRDTGDSVLIMRLTKADLASGKRAGPRLFFCGDLLDGQPPLYRESTLLVDTPEQARSAVTFLADQGADCIKVYNSVKEPELKEIVATARDRGLPVIGHVPRTLTMTHAVELGMRGLEHIRVTGREMLPPAEADTIDFLPLVKRETLLWQRFDLQSEKMRRLVSFLSSRHVFLDPTLVADQSDFVVPWADQMKNPDNQYLPPPLLEKWKTDPLPDFLDLPADLRQKAAEGFEKRKRFVAMCRHAGVRVIAGSDGAGLGTLLPGFGLQRELLLLVQSGLTPLEALQAATVESAAALGKEHDLGVVEAGQFADLLVVAEDPLENIENARKIEWVIAAGKAYRPVDLLTAKDPPNAGATGSVASAP